jgi:hypothetical protein
VVGVPWSVRTRCDSARPVQRPGRCHTRVSRQCCRFPIMPHAPGSRQICQRETADPLPNPPESDPHLEPSGSECPAPRSRGRGPLSPGWHEIEFPGKVRELRGGPDVLQGADFPAQRRLSLSAALTSSIQQSGKRPASSRSTNGRRPSRSSSRALPGPSGLRDRHPPNFSIR